MNVQSAIHIMHEECVRLEKRARDLRDSFSPDKKACIEWAEDCEERAEAARILIRIARAFSAAAEE
jgi:tRNA A37 threonylcarbamoyladenosine biosynthesis protein TsaE